MKKALEIEEECQRNGEGSSNISNILTELVKYLIASDLLDEADKYLKKAYGMIYDGCHNSCLAACHELNGEKEREKEEGLGIFN